jgi:hypothetical protein
MTKNYRVTNSFENDERNKCVDIIQTNDGLFRFQEWRRDTEDLHGWFLLCDSQPRTFDSEEDAIRAACEVVVWMNSCQKSIRD